MSYLTIVNSTRLDGTPKDTMSVLMVRDTRTAEENLAVINKAIVDLQTMAADLGCGPYKMQPREYSVSASWVTSPRIQPIKDLRSCANISLRLAKELIVHIDNKYGLDVDPLPKAIYTLNAIYARGHEIESINCNMPSFHKMVREII